MKQPLSYESQGKSYWGFLPFYGTYSRQVMTELQTIYSSHMLLRSRRVELRPLNSTTLGHFRVPETLTFKSRLGENLSCENEFYLHEN